MKKYRAYGLAVTILDCMIAVVAFGFPVLLYSYWSRAGNVPVVLFPTLGILFIAYKLYAYSYSLKITDDGTLIETQIFRKARLLPRSEVSSIILSYYPFITFGYADPLIASPRFMNDRYKKFPRYGFFPVNVARQIIDRLEEGGPEIAMDGPTKEFLGGTWFPRQNATMRKQSRIALLIVALLLITYFWFVYSMF